MYEPIIKIAATEIHSQMEDTVDGLILKQIGELCVAVDKGELLRALQYDRDQYDAGFADGSRAATPKWISVKEALPEEYKPVLICRDDGVVETAYLKDAKKKEWRVYGTQLHRATHWMPLPAAPKEVE